MPNEIGSFSSASVSAESWAKGASQPDQMIPSEAYRNVTATPEFMIKIDGVDTKSTLENFKDHVQLFHFNYRLSRLTNPNAADQLYTSARVVIEDPVMVIPNGNIFAIAGGPHGTASRLPPGLTRISSRIVRTAARITPEPKASQGRIIWSSLVPSL